MTIRFLQAYEDNSHRLDSGDPALALALRIDPRATPPHDHNDEMALYLARPLRGRAINIVHFGFDSPNGDSTAYDARDFHGRTTLETLSLGWNVQPEIEYLRTWYGDILTDKRPPLHMPCDRELAVVTHHPVMSLPGFDGSNWEPILEPYLADPKIQALLTSLGAPELTADAVNPNNPAKINLFNRAGWYRQAEGLRDLALGSGLFTAPRGGTAPAGIGRRSGGGGGGPSHAPLVSNWEQSAGSPVPIDLNGWEMGSYAVTASQPAVYLGENGAVPNAGTKDPRWRRFVFCINALRAAHRAGAVPCIPTVASRTFNPSATDAEDLYNDRAVWIWDQLLDHIFRHGIRFVNLWQGHPQDAAGETATIADQAAMLAAMERNDKPWPILLDLDAELDLDADSVTTGGLTTTYADFEANSPAVGA